MTIQRTTILRFLHLLAYESDNFDRCIRLLLRIADFEDKDNSYDPVRHRITGFFRPYLSETHASLDQRLKVLRDCVESGNEKRISLGFEMLSVALGGPPWTGSGINEFGARPRDFGYWPNYDQFVEWRSAFIDVALEYGNTKDLELAKSARSVLAQRFRDLWFHEAIRDRLIDAVRALHEYETWVEGWKAIRSTIYFDYKNKESTENPEPIPDKLSTLESQIRPHDLLSEIDAYVLSKRYDFLIFDDEFDCNESDKYEKSMQRIKAKAENLGESFAISGKDVSILGEDLFSLGGEPKVAFGKGLAKGSYDHDTMWQTLVFCLENTGCSTPDCSVLQGFVAGVAVNNPEKATKFFDQSAKHPLLRQLIWMRLGEDFTVDDLDRCVVALGYTEFVDPTYSSIFWWKTYADLPDSRIIDLAERLLEKHRGDEVILEGLSMKLHSTDSSVDVLGENLRRIGLIAATQCLDRRCNDLSKIIDHDIRYSMKKVIDAALRFEGNDHKKITWLDQIFAIIDKNYRLFDAFDDAIQTTARIMPEEFLDRVFIDDDKLREIRCMFIRQGISVDLPLAKIEVRTLIDWCKKKSKSGVWSAIASSINLWVTSDNSESIILSDDAIAFLEAAPDVGTVLSKYAEQIRFCRDPGIGRISDTMQPKAEAIGMLMEHSNPKIALAARSIYADLLKHIKDERERERHYDMDQEQRFE